MGSATGLSAAMPWPIPISHQPPMQETGEINVEKTVGLLAAIFAGLIALGVILRALFRPLLERIVYGLLKERCDRYDKAASDTGELADTVKMLEASIIQQGTVLRDMPRLISSVDTLSSSVTGLNESVKVMHEDMQEMREFKRYVQGVWDGQTERRERPFGRRADDERKR